MINTIKKININGNELEFYTTIEIKREHIIVLDKTCQMERIYYIGEYGYLSIDDIGPINHKIENVNQVIKAWKNNEIWF